MTWFHTCTTESRVPDTFQAWCLPLAPLNLTTFLQHVLQDHLSSGNMRRHSAKTFDHQSARLALAATLGSVGLSTAQTKLGLLG